MSEDTFRTDPKSRASLSNDRGSVQSGFQRMEGMPDHRELIGYKITRLKTLEMLLYS